MIKNLRYLCTLLLIAVASAAWGQKVTLDFTTQDWNLPTSSQVMNGNTYSSGDYTITFNSGNAYQATQTSGDVKTYYLLMGKSGASMSLPAFNFKVSKIVVTGRTGASASVKQNFYVGDDAVSTETTGATGVNTYEINESYRDIGTVYTLKVTSAHNTQITKIDIYEDDGSVVELSDPELSFTPTSIDAVYGEPFTVPTLSTAEGFDGSITYSSSDPSVATVKNSGEVTLVGAGETTITATSAPTKTFKSGTASYTLTVTVNEETEGVTYIKVTADDQVVVGKRFILVNEENNVANTLLGSNTYLGNVAITITDSKIVTEKAAPITLGGTSAGYSLKTSEGYINSVAAKKLSNSEEEVAIWNIVSTDDGYVVRGVKAETLGTIQYNASSPRFLNYTTTQKPAVLYVESDGVVVPVPTFNPVAGEVEAGTTVEIICPEEAEGVQYRIGTEGVFAEYTDPIVINEAMTIYARAYDLDINYSDVVSAAYTIKQDVPAYETVTLPYEETLVNSQGKFVIENVSLGGLEAVWKTSKYGMTANGLNCTGNVESWFVSPLINTGEAASVSMTFDQNLRYFANNDVAKEQATLWVREGADGSWVQLTIPTLETVNNNDFSSAGVIDLSDYIGKTIQLGFKYLATTTNPGRWELKNLVVKAGEIVEKQEAGLSYEVDRFEATIGEDVALPILQNPNELEGITYSSSNEDAATVDEDGSVTLVGAGQTTIKASFAGDDSFNPGDASYLLVVKEKAVSGSDKYELVANASTLKDGDELIIASVDKDGLIAAKAMSTTQNNNNRADENLDVNDDGTVTPSSNIATIILEGETGAWLFRTTNGTATDDNKNALGYLYAPGGGNYLRTASLEKACDKAKATIAIDEDGNATIVFSLTETGTNAEHPRNIIRHNESSSLYSCYADNSSVTGAVQIYRKVVSTETHSGNVNGDPDGKVDIADVTALVNIIVNNSDLTPEQLAAGDFDNSGTLTVNDVEALVNKILGNQ